VAALLVVGLALSACSGRRERPGQVARPTGAAPGGDIAVEEILPGYAPRDGSAQLELEARFRAFPSAAGARATLAEIASRPRPAGSEAAARAGAWLVEQFEAAGLDAGLWEFSARLPWPTKVRLTLRQPGRPDENVTPGETPSPAHEMGEKDGLPPPYIAFSPPADLEAELVYAFLGRERDYATLRELGVEASRRVVLVRRDLDRSLRRQVADAARNGALAVLVAPEPGRQAPPDAVRREALLPPGRGAGALLPALPLGEREAGRLLQALGGPLGPRSWTGETGSPVRTGPGPARVALEMEFDIRPRAAVNAMARIEGTDWPEQLVVLGAPLDAWVHGAAASGTSVASLLEVARGLGALLEEGWRPRRTLLLAAWDGSFLGQAGSTAWLEQGPFDMSTSCLAYLDGGRGMSGPEARWAATPDLRVLLAGVTADARGIEPPDGRGDAGTFLRLGLATAEIGRPGGGGPVAGTAYDTVERLVSVFDPDLAGPAAGARSWGAVALRLSEAAIPLHNHAVTANRLLRGLNDLMAMAHERFDDNPPPVTSLRLALVDLRQAGEEWNEAAAGFLARAGAVRRGDEGREARRRLTEAGDLVRTVSRLFDRGRKPAGGSGCGHRLFCPDPERQQPARIFPGLQAAMEARSRSGFVSEALILTSAANAATHRLQTASDLLRSGAPGGGPEPVPPERGGE
jgi:N-acetylated-alpha-linked acidic dipeptidase